MIDGSSISSTPSTRIRRISTRLIFPSIFCVDPHFERQLLPTYKSMMNSGNLNAGTVVNKRYSIKLKLGKGSCGAVYLARDRARDTYVAIKVAHKGDYFLEQEKKAYKKINSGNLYPGMPELYGSFRHEDIYDCLVIQRLGRKSLWDIYVARNRVFSDQTIMLLGAQLVSRLEVLHYKNVLHRDLKPDNIIPGLRGESDTIYLIDFGVSSYIKERNGQHKAITTGNTQIPGNYRYASLNAHRAIRWSRRDDLESLGFVLLHLSRKGIPWSTYDHNPNNLRRVRKKKETKITSLCGNIPAMKDYMNYVRGLVYDEKPDYHYLKTLFTTALSRMPRQNGGRFDWIREKHRERRHSHW